MEIRTIKRKKEVIENDNQKAKVVRTMSVARRILHLKEELGIEVSVIDLKPDRTDPSGKRSVVIFRDDENFQKVFSKVLDEIKDERSSAQDQEIKSLREELAELRKKMEENKSEEKE